VTIRPKYINQRIKSNPPKDGRRYLWKSSLTWDGWEFSTNGRYYTISDADRALASQISSWIAVSTYLPLKSVLGKGKI
jgi:hypothetical protein